MPRSPVVRQGRGASLGLAPWRRPDDGKDTVRQLLALHGRFGRLWEVAAVKLFIDGTIDGGTAWLHEPDCHGQPTAAYWQGPGGYTESVRVLAGARVQIATHAIGDAAVQYVLDTLACRSQAMRSIDSPSRLRGTKPNTARSWLSRSWAMPGYATYWEAFPVICLTARSL